MTQAEHAPQAIFLIDSENLFYDYGLWLSEDRFGYRKHLLAPGLGAAVELVIDRDIAWSAADRALENCVAWCEYLTQREVITRSYGKDVDWGVKSVKPTLERLGIKHVGVDFGQDKADLALKADFERARKSVDMFIFGGEDRLLRTAVKEYVCDQKHELHFAFIVPERNFGALAADRKTTPQLNKARIAMLRDSERFVPALPDLLARTTHGRRYYAALGEAVVPTAATIKADPARPAKRAPAADSQPALTEVRPAPPHTNVWELIAIKLMARPLMRRPALAQLQEAAWRDTLRAVLRRRTPDLSDMADQLADRLLRTFTDYPMAAADLSARNDAHSRPDHDPDWPVQLAAAALLPEIVAGVPDLSQEDPRLRLAYRRAHQWIDSRVS